MFDHYVRQLSFGKYTITPSRTFSIENTYVIRTSDNGGMERVPGDCTIIFTDGGKINAKEGEMRYPGYYRATIRPGQKSHVDGAILPNDHSWTGTKAQRPKLDVPTRTLPAPRNLIWWRTRMENRKLYGLAFFPWRCWQSDCVDRWKLIKNWLIAVQNLNYQLLEFRINNLKGP